MLVLGECIAAHHEGVAGTALFGLENESDAVVRNRFLHTLSCMADDGVDVFCRDDFFRGVDHVLQKGLTANLVEYFWQARLQPRALPGREDHNR